MKRQWRVFVAIMLATTLSACSQNVVSGPAPVEVPAAASGGTIRPLSLVTGTWTGSETATVGESGAISVTFTQTPTADTAVSASIGGLGYSGTLTGTLDHMVITVTDYRCGYVAVGSLNAAGTQITGTYTGTGPGVCSTKAGTFILNGQSAVLSNCPVKPADKPTTPPGNGGNGNGSGGNGNTTDPNPDHGCDPGQGNNAH